jgi:hypothetical protein
MPSTRMAKFRSFLKVAQLGIMSGLLGCFQRIILVAFFGWTFAFASRLRSHART